MSGKSIRELYVGETAQIESTISLENAQRYAEITQDNNPLHFDTEEARRSRYRRPIAHGMILAGFVSGVIGAKLPGFGCIYESQTMRFLHPVFYGERILTRVTVKELLLEQNRVRLLTECLNEQDQTVMVGEAVILPRKEK